MKNNEEMNDLMYEFALMHKAMLYYAGVKKEALEKAAFKYLDLVDEANSEDDFELILKTVELLKERYSKLFN